MNRKSVIIKSNKYGLTVILDDKMPFQELLLDIADKFQESANFFRNAKMAVTFRGRVLNREEERQVIETIVDHGKRMKKGLAGFIAGLFQMAKSWKQRQVW